MSMVSTLIKRRANTNNVVQNYYYMYNGHADVTALINEVGTIVATYYYDAFGNVL